MTAIKDLISDSNLLALYQLATDQGWNVTPTNSGKIMWYPPDKTKNPVTSPLKLNGRSYANVRTALARQGLDITSLKNSKAKPRPVLATDNPHAGPDIPLTEREQFHVDFQKKIAEIVAEEMGNQGVDMDNQERADLVNIGIDLFLVESAKALVHFTEATRAAFQCSCEINDEALGRIEEAERLYLETCTELENVRKSADKTTADLSRVGSELQTALIERNDAMERANRAENKLAAFRAALKED